MISQSWHSLLALLSREQSVGVQVGSYGRVVDQTGVPPGVGPLDGGRLVVHRLAAVDTGAVLGGPEGPRGGAQRAGVVVRVAGRGPGGQLVLVLLQI